MVLTSELCARNGHDKLNPLPWQYRRGSNQLTMRQRKMSVIQMGPIQALSTDPVVFQVIAQQKQARQWCGKRGISWRRLKDLAIHHQNNISCTGFTLCKQTNVKFIDITKGSGKVWYLRRYIYRHNYR
jgi:hypothetical protein